MIFSERKKHAEALTRQAAGENLWVEKFPEEFRVQLVFAMNESSHYPHVFIESAQYRLCKKYGRTHLKTPGVRRGVDFTDFIQSGTTDDIADGIEIFIEALSDARLQAEVSEYTNVNNFVSEVRRLLYINFVAFDLFDGEIIPRGERQLYGEIIEPLLGYLGANPDFAKAKTAYLNGVEQIKKNDGANAITDFGTAVEELLRALGATGANSSKLKDSAEQLNIIKPWDKKLIDWIATERNEGEAHFAEGGTLDDAWLHAHIAGAVLLRLSKGTAR